MRLSEATLGRLPSEIVRPGYDRSEQKVGIVHFGLGAFHRAHQAWYTEQCLAAGERDWAIVGVSLRSEAVAAQLNPQGGLYTLTAGGTTQAIGALRGVLVAKRDDQAIEAALGAPDTRVVTLTVTEKGYCRAPDGSLDLALARRGSFYPYLAAALERRRRAGARGLSLISCDNLMHNGDQLGRLIYAYLAAEAPHVADWFAAECVCPNSMIDRIVPATTAADLDALEARLGLRDEGAVLTERFSQWVIEDRFAGPRPGWERHGAQLVADVAPFEAAKLRMLNGAHSALAYLGLARGHEFVHQAIADPPLRELAERLMLREAAPTISAAPGQDLAAYAETLLQRFADPSLAHRLEQIAMDGSEKVPQRWLPVLAWREARGAPSPALLAALAGFLLHMRGDVRPVRDPRAAGFERQWEAHGAAGIVDAAFGPGGLLPSDWRPADEDRASIEAALAGGLQLG